MENILYAIVLIVGSILGLNFFRRNRDKQDNERQAQHLITDGKLKEQQKNKGRKLLELQKKMEDARREGRNLSEKDIEDFWNED